MTFSQKTHPSDVFFVLALFVLVLLYLVFIALVLAVAKLGKSLREV